MKRETTAIFKEIIEKHNAFIPDGMRNPVKIHGDTMTMYCVFKGKIYECLLDTCILDKLKNLGTWVAHGRKDRDEIYILSCKCSSLHRHLKDCPKGMVIDHENGNSLDNRLSNIRVVNQGTNMLNKILYKNNKYGVPNLITRNGIIAVQFRRVFYNVEYAKEAAIKMHEILDYYSMLDAKDR